VVQYILHGNVSILKIIFPKYRILCGMLTSIYLCRLYEYTNQTSREKKAQIHISSNSQYYRGCMVIKVLFPLFIESHEEDNLRTHTSNDLRTSH
jgi:hypothetical protein